MAPSGIDKEKIMLQLGRLEEHLTQLKEIKGKIDSQRDDLLISASERSLQLAIQDCLNIGSHLIAGLGFPRADTYQEVFTRLKEKGVLPEELGTSMERFASFRNRLVHLYWEVGKEEVLSKLQEIDSLKEFARQILEYVKDPD
jgi:uncharacterized protein YutE (UPF0331/DUF86 family)